MTKLFKKTRFFVCFCFYEGRVVVVHIFLAKFKNLKNEVLIKKLKKKNAFLQLFFLK